MLLRGLRLLLEEDGTIDALHHADHQGLGAVQVAACTGRRRVKGPVLRATASILPESASEGAERLWSARYPVAKGLG